MIFVYCDLREENYTQTTNSLQSLVYMVRYKGVILFVYAILTRTALKIMHYLTKTIKTDLT
ncbi:MAG: hypothetical protein A2X05_14465 [Bacteroidetes bacterium GWE2_41_25]|nr:MAG: hypothetical protein A2X03_09670 [Bacteroidetes bacterium GWA2_40_15]OFX92870.1 MAG: hypothetical protein A2X06_15730 [Bacteroidetes bacterium GWC2_40_22]OFX93610.1 MAG: hypothetical protein A2X05_14465 [Bacteroidetes bacterium GWE2_41_25]OFY57997.1 MAG: hypothetical protein A2X04_12270 [Bacteroidetes bacterium GWF2_41_9]HAM09794.1 hypothetical protein [Bacteroidales bacterium]